MSTSDSTDIEILPRSVKRSRIQTLDCGLNKGNSQNKETEILYYIHITCTEYTAPQDIHQAHRHHILNFSKNYLHNIELTDMWNFGIQTI